MRELAEGKDELVASELRGGERARIPAAAAAIRGLGGTPPLLKAGELKGLPL